MKKTCNDNVTNIGLIGAGYIGKAHSHAYRNLNYHPLNPQLHSVSTSNINSAKQAANNLGFPNYTDNWRDICENKNIDIICIASPVDMHYEQAKLALINGKNISLEKPIVENIDKLIKLKKLAQQAGVKISIGYNYIHNPIIYYAKELISASRIGDLVSFRIIHSEEFLSQQEVDFKPWHILKEVGGGGVLRDIGPHPLAMINFLIGEIKSVSAIAKKQYSTRGPNNTEVTIDDDHVDALLDMGNNLQGTFSTSWVNYGRGMHLSFEIYGTKGAICFSQERLNELDLYLDNSKQEKGRLTIRAGTQHPDFDLLCPGDEHGIGFMDLKTLEAKKYLDAIYDNKETITNLDFGIKIEQQIDTIYQSIKNREWLKVKYDF